eukprot:Lithocolla_globosa_v1_NODE_214_length_5084_cov_10.333665.p1 type:complete len:1658 gc:universal NODE_214_length_5084_cov_10.333665:50-5023(+)
MDFFGSSDKKEKVVKINTPIQKTGGFIDGLTWTLVKSVCDGKEDVQSCISKSLEDVGHHHPALVLSSAVNYLQNEKAGTTHRVLLLTIMANIVDNHLQNLTSSLVSDLIHQAFVEMTSSDEVKADWQNSAARLLVACGRGEGQGPQLVMEAILKKLPPGVMPHYFVVKAVGDFAYTNALAFVPYLKDVFGRLTALLGMIKHDNMRWVFTATIGHFCESITRYLADATPEAIAATGITKHTFSGEVFSTYEMMWNHWLSRNESSLRLSIVQSVGFMSDCMDKEQFEQNLPKIVQGILSLYKREKIHYPITNGFGMVLEVAVAEENQVLEPLLNTILQALHTLTCSSSEPDGTNQMVMKNYNELLRCFEIIARTFSDTEIAYLIRQLEMNNEKVRIGTLNILKHLINANDDALENKKGIIVSGLSVLLAETNTKVKKAFAQVVITLASHDYLGLEGGHLLVEFIVRQCSITQAEENAFKKVSKHPIDAVSPFQLRSMCDNILNLLTTTIPQMEQVLWPYLMELIIPFQYTDALSTIFKSLAFLANKKREAEDDDYMIDFDKEVNLPKPQAIVARLLVVLSRPFERPSLGMHALQFARALGPVLHPSICDMWDDVIPKMATYLKEKSEDMSKWPQLKWEDLVLKFSVKTIDEVNDEEWLSEFGEEMCNQIQLYNHSPELKAILFKNLGVILQKSTKKAFIRDKLDYMFSNVNHAKEEDRMGCAMGYGQCATHHLDIVLDKLSHVGQNDLKPKSSGFFGDLFSDGGGKAAEMTKCTLMLCYGYAGAKADPTLIKARMEAHILTNILSHFPTAKSPILKEHIVRCVDLLGKTMHPSHLHSEYICHRRKDLNQTMVRFLAVEKKEEQSPLVQKLSLQAIATLVSLEPILPLDEEAETLQTAKEVLVKLPGGTEQLDETVTEMLESFNSVLSSLMEKDLSGALLTRMLSYFEKDCKEAEDTRRDRTMEILVATLRRFLELKKDQIEEGADVEPAPRNPKGGVVKLPTAEDYLFLVKWIGILAPRCTDTLENVRVNAVECISLLAEIKGIYTEPLKEGTVEKFEILRDRVAASEQNTQFGVVYDLSRLLSPNISAFELFPFIEQLLLGLSDSQPGAACGNCIVLNGMLRLRGVELELQVPIIMMGFHTAMQGISNEQTLNGTQHALRTLSNHHLGLVGDQLLTFDLPHDAKVVKSIHTLAKDPKLAEQLMNHYITLLNNSMPYTEKGKEKLKEGTKQTMHATVTLGEIFQVEEMEQLGKDNLHVVLCTLLVRLGSCHGIKKENSFNRDMLVDARDAFVSFLKCIDEQELVDLLSTEETLEGLRGDKFYDTISTIATAIFDTYEEPMKDIVSYIEPFLGKAFDNQRITTAACFAAFIKGCDKNEDLLRQMVNALNMRMLDTNLDVRLLVLRGFGNVSFCGEVETNRYASTILGALINGLEDPKNCEPTLVMEAMAGLNRVVEIVDANQVVAILVNIVMKLRPYFEMQNNDIRAQAILLFGQLHRFGDGPCKALLYEQIHTNLVSLLMHLNDEDEGSKRATKTCLKQLGPLFQADDINQLFQSNLREESSLLYGEFMHTLSKMIIANYGRYISSYLMDGVNFFTSTWKINRGNSAMLVGFILGNLPVPLRKTVNVDHVTAALTDLLKDDDANVRKKVSEAMSFLYDY